MLDFDGTLAPLRARRDAARPLKRSLVLLRQIAASGRTKLAIVSGRPLDQLVPLVGPIDATLIGEHGWERRTPGGRVVRLRPSREWTRALDEAERLAIGAGLRERLERKRASVVLHTRGLPSARARRIERRVHALWTGFRAQPGLRLDRTSGGLELRANAHHKGTAVRALVGHAIEGTLAVFLGDDATDEDAFRAVRPWGYGLRVGREDRPTAATGRLPAPSTVPRFLREWLRVSVPPRSGRDARVIG